MGKKLMSWKTKGMNRDLSVSAFNPEFAFENVNLRLSTNEGNTLMSWVTERGTSNLTIKKEDDQSIFSIYGYVIGTAIIDHKLVLFTQAGGSNPPDYIYLLHFDDTLDSTRGTIYGKILYSGYLGFSEDYPIETLASYESDAVQKVYWVDGKNQPRVINVVGNIKPGVNTQFDFLPALQLNEIINVNKLPNGGSFPAGVIQYAFTYYNEHGQESNIFYTSTLRYVSPVDRGAAPDETVDNAFEIGIDYLDENFDYLRIYSIQRTSLNATPIVKRVADIKIADTDTTSQGGTTRHITSIIDTGTIGDTVDPTEILYKNRDAIIASTIEQKDATLFLGNIVSNVYSQEIANVIQDASLYNLNTHSVSSIINSSSDILQTCNIPNYNDGSYPYGSQLSLKREGVSAPCSTFRPGNTYRFGIQLQDGTGKWTPVLFLRDNEFGDSTSERSTIANNGSITFPVYGVTITAEATTKFINYGFKKVRPVMAVVNQRDRDILYEGVICPTLYTDKNRGTASIAGTILGQSSWFFRPLKRPIHSSDSEADRYSYYAGEYGYGTIVGSPKCRRTLTYPPGLDVRYNALEQKETYVAGGSIYDIENIKGTEIQGLFNDDNKFNIDWNLVTFHCPDIELNDFSWNQSLNNCSYRQVGKAIFRNTLSDIDVQTETPTISPDGNGFVHVSYNMNYSRGIIGATVYDDSIVTEYNRSGSKSIEYNTDIARSCKWLVYPWHRKGSLNNDIQRPADMGVQSALLKKKTVSNLRVANTAYNVVSDQSFTDFSYLPQVFNGSLDLIVNVNRPNYLTNIYQGNVDTVLVPDKQGPMYLGSGNYPITADEHNTAVNQNVNYRVAEKGYYYQGIHADPVEQTDKAVYFNQQTEPADIESNTTREGSWKSSQGGNVITVATTYNGLCSEKDIVPMKYKSSPHIVMYQNYDYGGDWNIAVGEFWLPVFEIKQTVTNRYGGNNLDALKANIWIPCGEPAKLGSYTGGTTYMEYRYGDTYFQRYDCLKTYPYSTDDVNQIVEIGSFMLYTNVNADGRYDRNRGQINNLNMSPRNFNLINPIYSQLDNFFNYRLVEDNLATLTDNAYSNYITWSKTKQSGADVDLWTDITLASTLEMDGTNGKVQKLIMMNNQLLCFQDTGISQILYNESVQVSASNGVPIEIANSGKVTGKRYITNSVGTDNKWSIVQTPSGIYFIDSNDKSIYLFNGQLSNLSVKGGMNSWCKQHIPSAGHNWNPHTFGNFISVYDRLNQDVYFIDSNNCLAFSERVGAFTSFYDYNATSHFCTLDDVGIWIKGSNLWKHQAGNYCTFFGIIKPYSITLVGNPEPQTDKIFTNLEFRANVEGDGTMDGSTFTPTLPFDTLETWNDYQHGTLSLANATSQNMFNHGGSSSALLRKFRIWRCDIPRDNAPVNAGTEAPMGIKRFAVHVLDRMRNPWLYLKLTKTAGQNKTEIHDVVMTYFN